MNMTLYIVDSDWISITVLVLICIVYTTFVNMSIRKITLNYKSILKCCQFSKGRNESYYVVKNSLKNSI